MEGVVRASSSLCFLSTLETHFHVLPSSNLLESISKDLDRLSQSGTQYYESSSISGAEVLRVTVTSASIAQSLEWLQYISNAFKRELLEKKNILERLDYTNPEGISFFCDQWTSPIHLDYGISTPPSLLLSPYSIHLC